MDLYITYTTTTFLFSQGYHTDKQDDLMDAYKIYNQKGKFAEEQVLQIEMKLSLDCLGFFFPCLVITTTTLMYIRST